ncbi:MAG: hypothetical protein M1816_006704 [Peltula sp. TS41687]|nr:MAG: hypothetical protein M1816_006704 [Peltula sp. TS41687]
MSRQRPLRGACSCGRNRYTVEVPQESNEIAQIFFDSGSDHRRHQASPLTAFLRIPLAWYHSATYSFYPDETHTSIRRAYSSPSHPNSKRHFCGYCGTPLSYWTEEPATEADFISLTLGSLIGEDLRELEDLGLLPPEAAQDAKEEREEIMRASGNHDLNGNGDKLPWFETLMDGSRLGRMSRSRRIAKARSRDASVTVEWEIVEWDDDSGETNSLGKRKIGEMDDGGSGQQQQSTDVEMDE